MKHKALNKLEDRRGMKTKTLTTLAVIALGAALRLPAFAADETV